MEKTAKIELEYIKVEELIPYKNNARKHGDVDIDAIMASIREFGFNDPIGIWKNIIIEGHGRLIAAKRLGMEMVPVIRLEHLTDEQRRAYALAHNKTAELSGWDFEVLESELQDLADIDMSHFGFNQNTAEDAEEVHEDEYEIENMDASKVQVGQVWVLGNHRLMCGDSSDKENMSTLMGG